MGCLYCGKEIGPFRIIRDKEFCSSAHRKSYGARLAKTLNRMGVPDPPPAGVAGFRAIMPLQEGNRSRVAAAWDLASSANEIRLPSAWPVSLPPVRGRTPAACAWPPAVALAAAIRNRPLEVVLAPAIRLPRFSLASIYSPPAIDDLPGSEAQPAGSAACEVRAAEAQPPAAGAGDVLAPGICGRAAGPQAEAVEALLPEAPYASALPFAAATVLPELVLEAAPLEIPLDLAAAMAGPQAEAVEALLPEAPYACALPFAAATVLPELVLEPAPLEIPVGQAGAMTGLRAEAVEALLPETPYACALPFAAATVLPELVLEPAPLEIPVDQAGAMTGLRAEAVEALLPEAPSACALPFAAATVLPELVLEPVPLEIPIDYAGAMAGPQPEAVEALLVPAPQPAAIPYPAASLLLAGADAGGHRTRIRRRGLRAGDRASAAGILGSQPCRRRGSPRSLAVGRGSFATGSRSTGARHGPARGCRADRASTGRLAAFAVCRTRSDEPGAARWADAGEAGDTRGRAVPAGSARPAPRRGSGTPNRGAGRRADARPGGNCESGGRHARSAKPFRSSGRARSESRNCHRTRPPPAEAARSAPRRFPPPLRRIPDPP